MDYRLRPELDEDNTRRVTEWVRRLREEHAIDISPNRLVNLIISSLDSFEVDQVISITTIEKGAADGSSEPRKKRLRRRKTYRIGL